MLNMIRSESDYCSSPHSYWCNRLALSLTYTIKIFAFSEYIKQGDDMIALEVLQVHCMPVYQVKVVLWRIYWSMQIETQSGSLRLGVLIFPSSVASYT